MPRWVRSVLIVLAALALLPFACIYRARHAHSPLPRIHLVQGMDNQPRYQEPAGESASSPTRARRGRRSQGRSRAAASTTTTASTGDFADGTWIEDVPRARHRELCSGAAPTASRSTARPATGWRGTATGSSPSAPIACMEGTWVPPTSVHDATVLARPVGHLFNSITNGIRTMPSYGSQIPVDDRWAIVAYVRALQRGGHAPASVLTAEERAKLVEVAP